MSRRRPWSMVPTSSTDNGLAAYAASIVSSIGVMFLLVCMIILLYTLQKLSFQNDGMTRESAIVLQNSTQMFRNHATYTKLNRQFKNLMNDTDVQEWMALDRSNERSVQSVIQLMSQCDSSECFFQPVKHYAKFYTDVSAALSQAQGLRAWQELRVMRDQVKQIAMELKNPTWPTIPRALANQMIVTSYHPDAHRLLGSASETMMFEAGHSIITYNNSYVSPLEAAITAQHANCIVGPFGVEVYEYKGKKYILFHEMHQVAYNYVREDGQVPITFDHLLNLMVSTNPDVMHDILMELSGIHTIVHGTSFALSYMNFFGYAGLADAHKTNPSNFVYPNARVHNFDIRSGGLRDKTKFAPNGVISLTPRNERRILDVPGGSYFDYSDTILKPAKVKMTEDEYKSLVRYKNDYTNYDVIMSQMAALPIEEQNAVTGFFEMLRRTWKSNEDEETMNEDCPNSAYVSSSIGGCVIKGAYPLETDVYTVTRMLRSFRHSADRDVTIVYGGAAHIKRVSDFFKYVGASTVYRTYRDTKVAIPLDDELREHLGLTQAHLSTILTPAVPISDAVHVELFSNKFLSEQLVDSIVDYVLHLPIEHTPERDYKIVATTHALSKFMLSDLIRPDERYKDARKRLLSNVEIVNILKTTSVHKAYAQPSLWSMIQEQ